jgi:hypothetical protein
VFERLVRATGDRAVTKGASTPSLVTPNRHVNRCLKADRADFVNDGVVDGTLRYDDNRNWMRLACNVNALANTI